MRATARKAGLAVAATALALGTLAGCGGDGGGGSSAPDDASTEDFCDAFGTLFEEIMAQALTDDPSVAIEALKDWADNMEEIGTPDDIPDQARDGFEAFIDAARDLPDDATLEDLENLGDDLSEADQEAGEAFSDWAVETCPSAMMPDVGDLPSDLPTEMPSELESLMSEMPTELPSELESMMSEMPTDPAELESMLSELTENAQ